MTAETTAGATTGFTINGIKPYIPSSGSGVRPNRGIYELLFREPLFTVGNHGYNETPLGSQLRRLVDAKFQKSEAPNYSFAPPDRLEIRALRTKEEVERVVKAMLELIAQPNLVSVERADPNNLGVWYLQTTGPWTDDAVARINQLDSVNRAAVLNPEHPEVLWVHLHGQADGGENMFDSLLSIVQLQQQ